MNNNKMASPSIMIPFAFPNITKARVQQVMAELKIGEIDRIDQTSMVCDRKGNLEGKTVHRFFIHFKSWSADWEADRDRILAGEELKIVYDEPWFWRCRLYERKQPKPERRAPYVERSVEEEPLADEEDEQGDNGEERHSNPLCGK